MKKGETKCENNLYGNKTKVLVCVCVSGASFPSPVRFINIYAIILEIEIENKNHHTGM